MQGRGSPTGGPHFMYASQFITNVLETITSKNIFTDWYPYYLNAGMNQWSNQFILAICILCLLPIRMQGLEAAKVERPNILLILTDDHRFDALTSAGHPFLETPSLDRLVHEGALIKNAYVTTSLCSPSRASILTGLYAHNHGVIDNYHPVRDDLTFFPQKLQEAGYKTGFIGKWHMGDTEEPQRGFDYWVSFKGQGIYWPHDSGLKVQGRFVPQAYKTHWNVNGETVPQTGYITDELTDYAIQWLENHLDDKPDAEPFFLYLSHKAAHADFLPPNRHAFRYEDKIVDIPPNPQTHKDLYKDVPMWVQNQINSRHGVEFAYYTDLDMSEYYRRYCETLLAVDESVGRIMDALQKRNSLDETFIIYMGDNGFLFGEHGLIDKRCAYEESIRIPMIIRAPAFTAPGTVIDSLIANIDVAPTILDVAQVQNPPIMDGRSFLPLLRQRDIPWRKFLLYEYFWERNYPQTPTMHAVFNTSVKFIRYHGVWDMDELFDLQVDPKEFQNQIRDPEKAHLAQQLQETMFSLLRESGGHSIPIRADRGTQYYHRNSKGFPGAAFPEWFYREAGKSGD